MLHLSYVVFFGHGTVSFVSIVSSLDASDRENYWIELGNNNEPILNYINFVKSGKRKSKLLFIIASYKEVLNKIRNPEISKATKWYSNKYSERKLRHLLHIFMKT